ncbi:hypothetical protein MY10362_000309 [Beauveria mimosiformis]
MVTSIATIKPRSAPTSTTVLDTDVDNVDVSAIDDDDSSGDYVQDSGESSAKLFQRVKPKANLIPRRSLITLALAQTERVPKNPQKQDYDAGRPGLKPREGANASIWFIAGAFDSYHSKGR